MKKLLAFLLCVFTVFQLIIPTIAADGQELKKISVFNGLENKLFTVIEKDGEIYSTVDDLRWIFEKHVNSEGKQRFVLTENETNFVFNLGEKYVMFSKEDKKIVVDPVSYSQDYSGTLVHEGKYYYPLSEILPWMNVECSVDNGVLVVKPDMKSVWEISKEIKQDNYQFNILNELGDSTSTAAALVAANVIDGFFAVFSLDIDRLIIIDDEQPDSWHTVNTYYDCLTEMATDDFMISEQAEKVLKNIKTVNKFDESIRDLFDMTNADVDIESILSGYETDKTKSADYAEMCNQFKMASDIADLAKGIDKVLPVLKTIEATSHVIPGYFDALISQQNNPDNSMAYQLALDRSVTTLKGKLPAIFTGITDFVLTGAFEDLGSALEKDYSKIFFVEGFSGAVGAVESVLTLVWPVNKAASDVAKLSVYYDIQRSSFVTANKYKFEATSVDNVHLMRVNYMLSLLASKKSYEAMKKVLDLIKQGDLKQNDIDKIDLMLVELAYAESAEENDAVCDKSVKRNDILECLKNLKVSAVPKTLSDMVTSYVLKGVNNIGDIPSVLINEGGLEKPILCLPKILLDSEDSNKVNKEMEDLFSKEQYNWAGYSESGTNIYSIYYTASIYENILSVVVRTFYMSASNSSKVFNFDIDSGKLLSDKELLSYLNLNESTVNEKITLATQNYFKQIYDYDSFVNSGMGDLYNIQLKETESEYIINNSQLIIYNNKIYADVPVPSMGGPNYINAIIEIVEL